MSSYRESTVDPNSPLPQVGPMRPYNWVQWIGVGPVALGGIVSLVFLLGEAGVISKFFARPPPLFAMFPLIGIVLVNSRRHPGSPVEEQQRRRNQRVLLITTAIIAPILIAAAAIDTLGAH